MARILTLPGVYSPRDDTQQLAEALEQAHDLPPRSKVLELCTGTGAVSVRLARRGHTVTAVDISRRAVANARLNALVNGVRIDARRGDLFGAVTGERFHAVVANPPYVPAPPGAPHSGPHRAWNAGEDGRMILDRICRDVPRHLEPGGSVLLIHSSLSDIDATREQLEQRGLETEVLVEEHVPLGPIAASRADWLHARGYAENGHERMTVIRGRLERAPAPQPAAERPPAAAGAWDDLPALS